MFMYKIYASVVWSCQFTTHAIMIFLWFISSFILHIISRLLRRSILVYLLSFKILLTQSDTSFRYWFNLAYVSCSSASSFSLSDLSNVILTYEVFSIRSLCGICSLLSIAIFRDRPFMPINTQLSLHNPCHVIRVGKRRIYRSKLAALWYRNLAKMFFTTWRPPYSACAYSSIAPLYAFSVIRLSFMYLQQSSQMWYYSDSVFHLHQMQCFELFFIPYMASEVSFTPSQKWFLFFQSFLHETHTLWSILMVMSGWNF